MVDLITETRAEYDLTEEQTEAFNRIERLARLRMQSGDLSPPPWLDFGNANHRGLAGCIPKPPSEGWFDPADGL
jgi:hypothetical protein